MKYWINYVFLFWFSRIFPCLKTLKALLLVLAIQGQYQIFNIARRPPMATF